MTTHRFRHVPQQSMPEVSWVTTENEETGRRLCCYGDRWKGTSPCGDPVTVLQWLNQNSFQRYRERNTHVCVKHFSL